MISPPRAIFFDLDETLIRHSTPIMEQLQVVCHEHLADLSEERWKRFQQHLMANMGQLWNNLEQHSGRCEAEFLAIFRAGLASADCNASLAETLIEDFLASVVESTGPTEGALALLDRLAETGIATGIITNGFSFVQKRKIKAHGLAERVRVVMTSEDAGAHKPDARVFRCAMAPLGVDAADCWHVGDNYDKDIVGACNAGLKGLLYVPEGPSDTAAQMAPAPYRVITRLDDVLALLA